MGFPSPANDFLEQRLDLNRLLIAHPASTHFVRAKGNAMQDAGIDTGDILIVDMSLQLQHDDIAVCCIEGELVLKRVQVAGKKVWLLNNATDGAPLQLADEFDIWGIVASVIKKLR